MTVSRILKKKGNFALSMKASESVQRAVDLLSSHDMGAVVVVDNQEHVIGIVSERDIVRAFKAHGSKALALTAEDLMTRSPFTCKADDRVDHVLASMDKRNFRHAPVIAEGKLAGMISIKDIVKLKLEEVQSEADEIRKYIAA
ncbi:MAG: CBS domain-containing protein [Pseudomonadota bacterium]